MKRLLLAVVLAGAAAAKLSCTPPVSVATFNIRMFPEAATQPQRVAERLAETDADIIAVQEIRSEDALLEVLATASRISGRDYRLALSSCGGRSGLATGIIHDQRRVKLIATQQFREHNADNVGTCDRELRPALLAVMEANGRRVAAISVHLQFGPSPEQQATRRRQWAGVLKIMQNAARDYGAEVVALGDFNSTGWEENIGGERDFILTSVKDAGLALATLEIPCTSYWQPQGPQGRYTPSVLDHMVVGGDDWSQPAPRGMCAEHACRAIPPGPPPDDFAHVSDHCPVRMELD